MGWGEPHRPLSPERLGVEMANAAYEQVAAERDRLRAALEPALIWLDYMVKKVAPDWSPSEEAVLLHDRDAARAALDPQEASE